MRKIRSFIITLIIMSIMSIICLVIVSLLSYFYKWQADKALIGITVTYILTGFIGGLAQKIQNKEHKNMGRKMLDAIVLSSSYILILIMASVFLAQIPFAVSSRFLMILMLMVGSTCLGRIL